jgi:hypothetical protein
MFTSFLVKSSPGKSSASREHDRQRARAEDQLVAGRKRARGLQGVHEVIGRTDWTAVEAISTEFFRNSA